jgi:hypothetical protein
MTLDEFKSLEPGDVFSFTSVGKTYTCIVLELCRDDFYSDSWLARVWVSETGRTIHITWADEVPERHIFDLLDGEHDDT